MHRSRPPNVDWELVSLASVDSSLVATMVILKTLEWLRLGTFCVASPHVLEVKRNADGGRRKVAGDDVVMLLTLWKRKQSSIRE